MNSDSSAVVPLRIALAIENKAVARDLERALCRLPGFVVFAHPPECSVREDFPNAEVVVIDKKFLNDVDGLPHRAKKILKNRTQVLAFLRKDDYNTLEEFFYILDGGFFYSKNIAHVLPSAIQLCNKGYRVFPAEAEPQRLLSMTEQVAAVILSLSLYECAVLQALERSSSESKLGELVGISRRQAGMHLTTVCKKLNVSSRAEAMRVARKHMELLHWRRRELMRRSPVIRSIEN